MQRRFAAAEREIMDDGLDPLLAMIVHCAADGIWMSSLFGLDHPANGVREQVIKRLLELTQGQGRPSAKG